MGPLCHEVHRRCGAGWSVVLLRGLRVFVLRVVVEFVCPSPCLELANSGRAKQLDCNLQTAETKNKRTRQIEAAIDRLIQESFLHVLLILGIGRPMDQ